MLKPALARVWRDRCTLQFGTDPGRAVVLTGVSPDVRLVLDLLDGTRDVAGVVTEAAGAGVDPALAREVVDRLRVAGLLDDGDTDTAVLRALDVGERDGLAPELAALSLLRPAPGAALGVLAARRTAHVALVGSLPLCRQLDQLLRAAGVGRVTAYGQAEPLLLTPGRHRPQIVVVTATGAVDPEAADVLLRLGVPHLGVVLRDLTGVVGPLVHPGRSSCLRCLDLHRCDRDAGWPLVALQLPSAPPRVPPYPAVLGAVLGGLAAMQVLAHLDGDRAATVDGTLEVAFPDWRVRRRSWSAHPDCGCGLACAG